MERKTYVKIFAFVIVLLLTALCFTLTKNLYYKPTVEKTEQTKRETNGLKYEISKLNKDMKDGDVKKWKAVIKSAEKDTDEVSNPNKSVKEKKPPSMPGELRSSNQLEYLMNLQREFNFQASSIVFDAAAKTVFEGADYSILSKQLSFDYRIINYDEFVRFIRYIQQDVRYPSAVVTFTIKFDADGAVSGNMQIANYYIPSDNIYPFETDETVSVGSREMFMP